MPEPKSCSFGNQRRQFQYEIQRLKENMRCAITIRGLYSYRTITGEGQTLFRYWGPGDISVQVNELQASQLIALIKSRAELRNFSRL